MGNKIVRLKDFNGNYTYPQVKSKGIVDMDTTPTEGSAHAVTSGGVKTYVDNLVDMTSVLARIAALENQRSFIPTTIDLATLFGSATGTALALWTAVNAATSKELLGNFSGTYVIVNILSKTSEATCTFIRENKFYKFKINSSGVFTRVTNGEEFAKQADVTQLQTTVAEHVIKIAEIKTKTDNFLVVPATISGHDIDLQDVMNKSITEEALTALYSFFTEDAVYQGKFISAPFNGQYVPLYFISATDGIVMEFYNNGKRYMFAIEEVDEGLHVITLIGGIEYSTGVAFAYDSQIQALTTIVSGHSTSLESLNSFKGGFEFVPASYNLETLISGGYASNQDAINAIAVCLSGSTFVNKQVLILSKASGTYVPLFYIAAQSGKTIFGTVVGDYTAGMRYVVLTVDATDAEACGIAYAVKDCAYESDIRDIQKTFTNVNVILGTSSAFADLSAVITAIMANADVKARLKYDGLIITYLTSEGWKTKQFHSASVTDETFANTANWSDFGNGAAVGNIFNVTNEVPLSVSGHAGEYYALTQDSEADQYKSAVAVAWEKGVNTLGLILSFSISATTWKTYQYVGASADNESMWKNARYWQDFGSLAAGSEPFLNINQLCGNPTVGYYTLNTALNALLAKQTESGVAYAKIGLVISYQTGEYAWETKQFTGGISDFSVVALWKDFGGSGGSVVTKDDPEPGGKDAFSTGGAYKHIPTQWDCEVDQDAGTVTLRMKSSDGTLITDEFTFNVGTGGGGQGTTILAAFENSPLYGAAGGSIVIKAAIQSVTTAGQTSTLNSISSVAILDRDTAEVLMTFAEEHASSPSLSTFDFSFDVSKIFVAAGYKNLQLLITDNEGNTLRKNIRVTAVDVTVESVQTLNYTADTSLVHLANESKSIPLYKFPNNASEQGITALVEIFVDGSWEELGEASIKDTYSHNVSINAYTLGLTHGAYLLRVHGEDVASGVVGNYLYTSIMVVQENNTTPIIATRWVNPKNPAELKRYEEVNIDFAVYKAGALSVDVNWYLSDIITGQTPTVLPQGTVTCGRGNTYSFKKKIIEVSSILGTEMWRFYATSGGATSAYTDIKIVGTIIDIEETAGAVINFDFLNRSNSESDHTIESNGFYILVPKSNWRTNGFVKDSFGTDEYGTPDDKGVMALRIAENIDADCDYKPFDNSSIEQNGLAIQFSLRKKNIADDNKILMKCGANGLGFILSGTELFFTSDQFSDIVFRLEHGIPLDEESIYEGVTYQKITTDHTIRHTIANDERVNVALMIEPAEVNTNYGGIGNMKMFLNGEEAGVCWYAKTSLERNASHITFDGTYADLYLFNLKAWVTYYSFEQAFRNYLLKMTDTDAMITEYNFNNVMGSVTAEQTTKNRPLAAKLYDIGIPYFVLCKNATTADNEAKDNFPDYLETLNGDKKTTRLLDIYAYFPKRPWANFKAIGCTVSNQGTTSSTRPIKNIKIKFKGKIKEGGQDVTHYAEVSLLNPRSNFSGDEALKWDAAYALAQNRLVQILETSIPTNIITVKVDYSESGGANNGASTQLFNELQIAMGSAYMTPAQKAFNGTKTYTYTSPEGESKEITLTGLVMNTSIDSIPCAFFRTDKYMTAANACLPSFGYFHSKGNWNDDKGDSAIYGFEKVAGYNKNCLSYGDFVEHVVTLRTDPIDSAATFASRAATYVATNSDSWDTSEVHLLTEFCGSHYAFYRYQSNSWVETTGTMTFSNGAWVVTGDVLNPVECYELLRYDNLDWFQGVNSPEDMLVASTEGPLWCDYFESRYPDDDDLNDLYAASQKVPFRLYKWLKFCQDCNQHLTESSGNIMLDGVSVAGTKANRLKKWKHELHKEANVYSFICYHVFTDYIAAVDQRSKNAMLGFYKDEDGAVRAYMNHLYDGDTIMGSDNDCGLTIPAELDPNTDTSFYKGWDSVAWKQIAASDYIWLTDYVSEADVNDPTRTVTVARIAAAMRSCTLPDGSTPFSYAGIYKYWITDRLSKFPKVVSSFDGERKYVERSLATANYYYALHGLNIQGLSEFVKKRFLFRDGFYQCGDLYSSKLEMRAVGTVSIPIKAAKSGFFGISRDRANSAEASLYLEKGETGTLQILSQGSPVYIGASQMIYVFGADKLEEIDISNMTPDSSGFNIGELKLLKKFVVGGEDYEVHPEATGYVTSLNLGTTMPFLEELDIRNTRIVNVSAGYCARLKKVQASGSLLSIINLAETSPITQLSLPSTMTELSLVNLPNLTYGEGGLTTDGLTNLVRLHIDGCSHINTGNFLKDVLDAQSDVTRLKYIRLTSFALTSTAAYIQKLIDAGVTGLDENGAVIEETGHCSGLFGNWVLSAFTDVAVVAQYNSYFGPNLSVHNSPCSVISFADDAENGDSENISNEENHTGYLYNNDYLPSGHVAAILAQRHRVKGSYDSVTHKMRLKQIKDDDGTQLVDGSTFDVTDAIGEGFDIFVFEPHYWYKGINDFRNQRKYLAYSSNTEEPISTASLIKRHENGDLIVGEAYRAKGVYISDFSKGDTFDPSLLRSLASCHVYRMDVEGTKRVRWTGLNNSLYGGVFVDADGKVISTTSMAVSDALFDFAEGDYILDDVPAGAKYFYFTGYASSVEEECIAVDSTHIEAMEPDWVEHEQCLVGAYKASINDITGAIRSISGQETSRGTGTSLTHTGWQYDSNGDPISLPGLPSEFHKTMKDYQNFSRLRGKGYQLVDYEMSKDIANLWMAKSGNRNVQAVCGNGRGAGATTGAASNTLGMKDSTYGTSNMNVFGYEDWSGNVSEWCDNIVINAQSFLSWYKNKCLVKTGDVVDHKWHIYNPIKGEERIVNGLNSGSGNNIARVKFGRFADIIASKTTSDTSAYNKQYCDGFWYSAATVRALLRSGGSTNAYGGLSYAIASGVSSHSVTYGGSRLAFRGDIVWEDA